MNIIRKARGTKIPTHAQRVFLSCDASSMEKRDAIIADLLSIDAGMDCVVSYAETPGRDIDAELLRNELREGTQLLVLYVTVALLQEVTATGVWPDEYNIARELHLPVLPVAADSGLFPRFTELAGAIHGIATSDFEYRAKLKAQMETFLLTDELMREIEEKAFTSTIFLSYRKKDIDEARRFMEVLHDFEEFEAVSIWYDNFLTAGRVFDEEIRASIDKSDAFVLLVTPNLLGKNDKGKDNYIVSTEYPYAKKVGKAVVPVEALRTDSGRLVALFPGAGQVASLHDSTALLNAFKDTLDESASIKQMDSERAYLLGMAYLKGFGVEKDVDRAIGLLKRIAIAKGSFAMRAAEQLADIYTSSNNYDSALYWLLKAADHCVITSSVEKFMSNILGGSDDTSKVVAIYNKLGLICSTRGDYKNALVWYNNALEHGMSVWTLNHHELAMLYNNIGETYRLAGEHENAIVLFQKALEIDEVIYGVAHHDTATIYNNIALTYDGCRNYQNALCWYEKARNAYESILGSDHTDTARTYQNIAVIYDELGKYQEALTLYQKALSVYEKILGTEHPDTATVYENLGNLIANQRKFKEALEWYQKSKDVFEAVFGKEHPATGRVYNNIATMLDVLGDNKEALEWYQKALKITQNTFGEGHANTTAIRANIDFLRSRVKTPAESSPINQSTKASDDVKHTSPASKKGFLSRLFGRK